MKSGESGVYVYLFEYFVAERRVAFGLLQVLRTDSLIL